MLENPNRALPENPEESPYAKEIDQFLKGEEASKSIPLTPELQAIAEKLSQTAEEESHAAPEVEESRIEVPVDPIFQPGNPAAARQKYRVIRDEEVEITSLEKALYIKQTQNGALIEMEVTLATGFTTKLRGLTNYEVDLSYFALEAEILSGEIKSTALHASYHQQYCLAMQLMETNGKPYSYKTFSRKGGEGVEGDVKSLIEASKNILDMPQTYFGLLTRCANIFNYKLKTLQEMAMNGDFWNPRDTD